MKSLGFILYENKVREFCEIGPCPTVSAIRKRWDMMTLEARGHYEALAQRFLEETAHNRRGKINADN